MAVLSPEIVHLQPGVGVHAGLHEPICFSVSICSLPVGNNCTNILSCQLEESDPGR